MLWRSMMVIQPPEIYGAAAMVRYQHVVANDRFLLLREEGWIAGHRCIHAGADSLDPGRSCVLRNGDRISRFECASEQFKVQRAEIV
jgi:hypothetical protein